MTMKTGPNDASGVIWAIGTPDMSYGPLVLLCLSVWKQPGPQHYVFPQLQGQQLAGSECYINNFQQLTNPGRKKFYTTLRQNFIISWCLTHNMENTPHEGPSQHLISRITHLGNLLKNLPASLPLDPIDSHYQFGLSTTDVEEEGVWFVFNRTLKLVLRRTNLLLGAQLWSGSMVQGCQTHSFGHSRTVGRQCSRS